MKTPKLSAAQTRVLAKLRRVPREILRAESEAAEKLGETLHYTTWHTWCFIPASGLIRLSKTWSGHAIGATIQCLEDKGHLTIAREESGYLYVELIDGPTETFELRVKHASGNVRVFSHLCENEAELREIVADYYGSQCEYEILDAPAEEPVTVREAGTPKGYAIPSAPNAATVGKALASKIAGELGAAEGSSERMQAERIIAAELEELVGFVERCFGSSITSAGESVFEETIRADAGKLLHGLGRVRVPMVGRDYNLVRHVLDGAYPWAVRFLHNRDLWAVRQELPTADLGDRSSIYYDRLTQIAEGRREAQEAATA